MLNMIRHGELHLTSRPLVIVHGLYGSARNWGVIARRLADSHPVIAVDQRNHGSSPWHDSHSYPDMAADLAEVIESLGQPVDVLGHSMGGKAAMVLALTRPELVHGLVVADIAPVAYTHSQRQYIEAMRAVDLSRVTKRSDAVDQLARHIEEPALRSFFTQSLDVANKTWALNLDALDANMADILGFPSVTGQFDGPVLFLSGENSDYVLPDHRPRIRELFPKARFARLRDAGHWLHAEQPRAFEAAVRSFLGAIGPA